MTIKPMSYLREKMELMAFYHPKALALITFCVALLVATLLYTYLWPLITPEYTVTSLTICDDFEIKITYPSRILPDTEYTISWQTSDNAQVVSKFDSPLVTLVRLEKKEVAFKVRRAQGWRYQVPLTILVSIDGKLCPALLNLEVYPWLKMLSFVLGGTTLLGMATFVMQIIRSLLEAHS